MMCLSPSKPFTFPSTTPPTQRPSSCKLSLFIPAGNTTSNVDCGFTPAPPKQTSTPIRTSRPKLSLKLGSEAKRPFASFAPLSLDTSVTLQQRRPSTDSVDGEEEDLTAKNTLANSLIKVDSVMAVAPVPSYTLAPGTKSILKRGGVASVSFASSSKVVSFETSPSYIPSPEYEDDSDVASEDEDNLSPPSTTSSTDSEESESDNEARTPVEEVPQQSGWMMKRLADKPGFGGGGRWKKAKREWVWTLGDVEQEPQFGVKVWGEDNMVIV